LAVVSVWLWSWGCLHPACLGKNHLRLMWVHVEEFHFGWGKSSYCTSVSWSGCWESRWKYTASLGSIKDSPLFLKGFCSRKCWQSHLRTCRRRWEYSQNCWWRNCWDYWCSHVAESSICTWAHFSSACEGCVEGIAHCW
jgi:hypothetical protein